MNVAGVRARQAFAIPPAAGKALIATTERQQMADEDWIKDIWDPYLVSELRPVDALADVLIDIGLD
ncbi:hypothetical protein XI06_24790 [Bradyrhizobium sp. CCBAU 11434]|nr:hypothetical protein [Bradyrhizobium sp. CCBAU 11434]